MKKVIQSISVVALIIGACLFDSEGTWFLVSLGMMAVGAIGVTLPEVFWV